MALFYFMYIFLLVVGIGVSFYLISRLLRIRKTPGAYYLIWAIACLIVWSIGYLLEISLPALSAKYTASKIEYLGIPFISLAIVGFSLNYSGHEKWLTRLRLVLLAIIPTATFLMAATNEWHKLLWSALLMPAGSSFGPLTVVHGSWYIINVAYSYALLLLAVFFMVQIAVRNHSLYRTQALIMLAGMLIPFIGNLIYMFRLSPALSLDWTPLAFTLTVILLEIGFVRFGLMDILPIAQNLIFNAIEDGVIVADSKNRIVEINPAAQGIFQSRDGRLIGREVHELLPAELEVDAQSAGTADINHELLLRKGQDQRSYNLRTTPILIRGDRVTGHLITLTDITEQKQAEEQLRKVNQEALDANRMKTQLLASISHDLRTPLGAIMGYAEMIQTGALGTINDQQQSAAAEILDSTNQLLAFVNNLISEAQIETGRVMLKPIKFVPGELIETIQATVKFVAQKKNLALETKIDPGLPGLVIGDPYWLKQILLNLVNNALKYTDKGSIQVSFLCVDRDHWAIQVKDTGIGIPKEAQKTIFEPFRQVRSGTRRQAGSGLGLFIVSQLTTLMNGVIELQSDTGQGSTFTIALPLTTN